MKHGDVAGQGKCARSLSGLLCAAAYLTALAAHAEPPPLNAMRAEDCSGRRGIAAFIEPNSALSEVARDLSRGRRLADAMKRSGYPAVNSASLYLKSSINDTEVREIIEDRYCTGVSRQMPLAEVGVYRTGNETWIVFAARAPQPAEQDSAVVAAQVLDLVNAARGNSRRCGPRRLDAVPPLTLSGTLNEVAAQHASDMAQRGSLDHRGSDGSQPSERVSRAGYLWRATGENIAAGQADAAAVVAAWLDSPGHCANIMGPQFTQMGIALALAPAGDPVIYWAQEFGAPR